MIIGFVAELACCWFMTGVIWLVQLFIYPLFNKLPEKSFKEIHNWYQKMISWIVVPVMGVELTFAFGLYSSNQTRFYLINFVGVLLTWALTGFVMVPLHRGLSLHGQSKSVISALISTNRFRTMLWSVRAILLSVYLYKWKSL